MFSWRQILTISYSLINFNSSGTLDCFAAFVCATSREKATWVLLDAEFRCTPLPGLVTLRE